MKKLRALALLLFVLVSSNAWGYEDGDFQIWNTDTEDVCVAKNTHLNAEQEFRWGGNASQLFYHHYEAGMSYDLEKWLSIGGGYRQVYQLSKNIFRVENEPYITFSLKNKFYGFDIDDRSRFEYRHFDYQQDTGRYRNKVTVVAPYEVLRMKPFVSDELFFDYNSGFDQNRFSVGVCVNVNQHLTPEVYYMVQDSKGSTKWTDANVLGLKLKLRF